VGVGDRVFEAEWSELGTRKQVGNCNRKVRGSRLMGTGWRIGGNG